MEGDATKKDRNIMEPYLLIKAGDSNERYIISKLYFRQINLNKLLS